MGLSLATANGFVDVLKKGLWTPELHKRALELTRQQVQKKKTSDQHFKQAFEENQCKAGKRRGSASSAGTASTPAVQALPALHQPPSTTS